jgi:hypothetical protein
MCRKSTDMPLQVGLMEAFHRLGCAKVQALPAGEGHITIDGFADERVAEVVAINICAHDISAQRFLQCCQKWLVFEAADGREHVLGTAITKGGGRAKELMDRRWECSEALADHKSDALGNTPVAVYDLGIGQVMVLALEMANDLAHEEGIPTRLTMNRLADQRRSRSAGHAGNHGDHRRWRQWFEQEVR